MSNLRSIGAVLGAILGLGALTSDAEAIVLAQCDSSTWPNNQTCSYSTGWFATVTTTSNAGLTAHAITISMPKGGGGTGDNFRFATAVALDGSSRVIPGSQISSIGPAVTRSFSTAASAPARRLQTKLDTTRTVPNFLTQFVTEDNWPQILNNRIFATDGRTDFGCRTFGSSDSTLTSHSASAQVIVNRAGAQCKVIVLGASGVVQTHDDVGAGSPTTQTFTTTFANRPVRIQAASF